MSFRPNTDFTSHHIEGMAVHGNTPFSVPLVSHIDGNLWTGGCRDGVHLPHDFLYVVSLYPWEKFEIGPRTARLECKLYDSTDVPDLRQLETLARIVDAFCDKGKTLVHCQAGLNRSGLVAALALILGGRTAADAIALLRERRCDAVLCNAAFETFLHEYTVPLCACGAGCTDGVCTAQELGDAA